MNNTQFRRLVLDTPTAARNSEKDAPPSAQRGSATPALGSRMRSSIPMTPRSVAGSSGTDFARQLAERNAELNSSNTKKIRSSAAPKGTKLGAGYQDRTQLRTSTEDDDKASRVKALEDMVKLGQMDRTTFEALRDQIIGGDVKDVHLVKGLDYKLLERVRRGEDVLSDRPQSIKSDGEDVPDFKQNKPGMDVDDEFDKLEKQEVRAIEKEQKEKKGQMAPPPPIAGEKRTRDEILKELKASRQAAAEKARQSALGPKFVKVGQKRETSRIEVDERGREILIMVNEDGKVRRKVKKAKLNDIPNGHGLLMPDKDATPLGMEVAPVVPQSVEEDDGDIFEGVGVDYNPLGHIEDDDDDSEDDLERPIVSSEAIPEARRSSKHSKISRVEPLEIQNFPRSDKKRNWLGESAEETDLTDETSGNPFTDPSILAALKKASNINAIPQESSNEEEAAKLARRKKMLECHDRDAEDMDMEFGSSRFGDQEDAEDTRVKLSVWGGDGKEEGGRGEGKGVRKRGPKKKKKKKKGDVNSATDVLTVMERRKNEDE